METGAKIGEAGSQRPEYCSLWADPGLPGAACRRDWGRRCVVTHGLAIVLASLSLSWVRPGFFFSLGPASFLASIFSFSLEPNSDLDISVT